ncbi:hypothetical protein [Arachidicoccus terrestris]|uniref:hypothetical protein n=1 Tax=Arachidicoccus terrestris TaxID=2875539 RepID=UPI001CC76F74|nr:hypothetical protein [Arachidicoccus terrestris]UAY57110.1 hypothetical protein K9M52_09015 [Arachidicoccus terrestris]
MFYIMKKALSPVVNTLSPCKKVPVNKDGSRAGIKAKRLSAHKRSSGGKVTRAVFIAFSFLLTFCILGNWGINAYRVAAGKHMHSSTCLQSCSYKTEEGGTEEGVLQQFFCPIVELPALHGVLISQD